MNKFDENEKIKERIVEYYNQFSEKEQKSLKIDGLLSHLSSINNKKITLKDVNNSFYESFYDYEFYVKHMKDKLVEVLSLRVGIERESINRLNKLLGKHLSHMDADEMEKNALKIFTTLFKDYKNLAQSKGIKLKEKPETKHQMDGVLLLKALEQIHNIKIEKECLVNKILDTQIDLGYFSNIFKENFKYLFTDHKKNQLSAKWKKTKDIWENFQEKYGREKNNLEAHLIFDKKLTYQHKISPPELLKDKTLGLDVKVLSIEFDNEDKLIILGQKYKKNQNEWGNRYKTFILAKYDIHTEKRINSIDEKIDTELNIFTKDLPPEASLSVGSNGIVYVGFYNQIKRFNGNLEILNDNEDKFQDAIKLLKKDILYEIPGGSSLAKNGLFQATENDGFHYFIVRPNELSERHFNNFLIASDGKKIRGKDIPFSPIPCSKSLGHISYGSDGNPRLVVHENYLYFKIEGNILKIDRSLTEEACEKSFKIIDAETLEHGFVPSYHCIDRRTGLVWAVTQTNGEVVSSIKAYRKGSERGEIVTHLYPLNASEREGLPRRRFMAISKNGILAHTDPLKKQINFYQIKEK